MTEMTVKEFQFDYKIGRIYREKEIVYLGKSLQVYTFFLARQEINHWSKDSIDAKCQKNRLW